MAPGEARRRTAWVVVEGTEILDLAGPVQALTLASESAPGSVAYELVIASANGGLVPTTSGLSIETVPLSALDGVALDTIIVPGGSRRGNGSAVTSWLRDRAPFARRICGVGMGAFVLAEAGLLHDRRAVVHWHHAEILRSIYPEIEASTDAILVSDKLYWTSAGMAASLDLALALIDEDLGRAAALEVAKRLVVFLWRRPDQPQIGHGLALQIRGGIRFADLHSWITNNPKADLRVEALAERAGMSPRTFARAYHRATGQTPARAVELMRIDLARSLLLNPGTSLKQISEQCGFGSEINLRRAFHKHLKSAPSAYRTSDR